MIFPRLFIFALLVLVSQANVVFSEDDNEGQPINLILKKPSIIMNAGSKLKHKGAYGESSRFTLEQRLHQLEQNNMQFQDKVTRLEEKVHHQNRQLALAKEEINLLMNVESPSCDVNIPLAGFQTKVNDITGRVTIAEGDINNLKKDVAALQTTVNAPPIYFYVQRSTDFGTQNVPIPFNLARLNVGGAMDSATGIFTAPRKGIYFFSWSGIGSASKYISSGLHVNGKRIGTGHATQGTGREAHTFSMQSTLQLNANDKVTVQNWAGNGAVGGNNNHFTGFILHTL